MNIDLVLKSRPVLIIVSPWFSDIYCVKMLRRMIQLNLLAILRQGCLGKDGLHLLRFVSVFCAGYNLLSGPLGHKVEKMLLPSPVTFKIFYFSVLSKWTWMFLTWSWYCIIAFCSLFSLGCALCWKPLRWYATSLQNRPSLLALPFYRGKGILLKGKTYI